MAEKKETTFDPGQHLSKIKGQDYLEVKWRIAWLRAEHPNATIETELHSHDNGRAIMRARVVIPDGGSSTGWGSVTVDDFENYLEKAETRSIGRALGALGFGTQFADDFADGDSLADAPVGRRSPGGSSGGSGGMDAVATAAQKSMIQYKAREALLEPQQLVEFIRETTGKSFNEMTKREASRVIEALSDGSASQGARSPQASGAANPPANRSQAAPAPHRGQSSPAGKPDGDALANPGQIKAIERLGSQADLDLDGILGVVLAITDREILELRELTSEEAGAVITEMQRQGA